MKSAFTPYRPFLLLIAAISFGLGIALPIIRFEKLWLFNETPSLLGIVSGLWNDGSIALSFIVALFSILFPIAKMAIAFQAIAKASRMPAWTGALGKWSLMDVMLVAIVIFAAKTSGLATAAAQPGIWFYALATLATALAGWGLVEKK